MIRTLETDGKTKSTLNKQQQLTVLGLIQKWKKILNLSNWEIGISTQEPSSLKHDMEIAMTATRCHAAIRISPRCWSYGQNKFEELIVHEMLHILFQPIEDEYDRVVDMLNAERKIPYHHKEVETTVDQIAKILYSLS